MFQNDGTSKTKAVLVQEVTSECSDIKPDMIVGIVKICLMTLKMSLG